MEEEKKLELPDPTGPVIAHTSKKGRFRFSRKSINLLAILLVAAIIPLTIFLSRQVQDIRQHAAGGASGCTITATGHPDGTVDASVGGNYNDVIWVKYTQWDEAAQQWVGDGERTTGGSTYQFKNFAPGSYQIGAGIPDTSQTCLGWVTIPKDQPGETINVASYFKNTSDKIVSGFAYSTSGNVIYIVHDNKPGEFDAYQDDGTQIIWIENRSQNPNNGADPANFNLSVQGNDNGAPWLKDSMRLNEPFSQRNIQITYEAKACGVTGASDPVHDFKWDITVVKHDPNFNAGPLGTVDAIQVRYDYFGDWELYTFAKDKQGHGLGVIAWERHVREAAGQPGWSGGIRTYKGQQQKVDYFNKTGTFTAPDCANSCSGTLRSACSIVTPTPNPTTITPGAGSGTPVPTGSTGTTPGVGGPGAPTSTTAPGAPTATVPPGSTATPTGRATGTTAPTGGTPACTADSKRVNVVFVSAGFTDSTAYQAKVDRAKTVITSAAPYSSYPHIFNFITMNGSTIPATQQCIDPGDHTRMNANCIVDGQTHQDIFDAVVAGNPGIKQTQDYLKIVIITNTGGDRSGTTGWTSVPDFSMSVIAANQDTPAMYDYAILHEVGGHMIGNLYDRYIATNRPLIPNLYSNCTDTLAHASFWSSVPGGVAPALGCSEATLYAPTAPNCPDPKGGTTNSVMSRWELNPQAPTCASLQFDPVERYWIENRIIKTKYQCDASTNPTTTPTGGTGATATPGNGGVNGRGPVNINKCVTTTPAKSNGKVSTFTCITLPPSR